MIKLKSIEFDESQLSDLQNIAVNLFSESDDPRNFAYRRILIRPKVSWLKIILKSGIPIICSGFIYTLLLNVGFRNILAFAIAMFFLFLCFCINLKRIIICCIHVYQKYAPESVRNKCRFEPSCSEYMILSLQKYGLVKGLTKGFKRIKRCNINDGGFDFP